MAIDAWLPIGFAMPSGESIRLAQFEDVDWQIYEAEGGGRVLVAQPSLAERWLSIDILESGALEEFALGTQTYFALTSKSGYTLAPVDGGTLVTSYYDWSSIDPAWKEAGIFPVISEGALRATLGILARTVSPQRVTAVDDQHGSGDEG